MQHIVIVHHGDPDGFMGGAVLERYIKDTFTDATLEKNAVSNSDEYIPYTAQSVYYCDVCPPIDILQQLLDAGTKVFIFDHHKSAEDRMAGFEHENLTCVIKQGMGACAVAYEYLYGEEKEYKDFPYALRMISEWDVWKHDDPQVVIFHYGVDALDWTNDKLWEEFLDNNPVANTQILKLGETVGNYWLGKINQITSRRSYIKNMDDGQWIVINGVYTSSYDFSDVEAANPDAVGVMWYSYDGTNNRWTASFRECHGSGKALERALSYGGGGHPGAAGASMTFEQIKEWM